MSLTQRTCGVAGLLVVAAAWLGSLPDLARQSFTAHMTMHGKASV